LLLQKADKTVIIIFDACTQNIFYNKYFVLSIDKFIKKEKSHKGRSDL